jgi:hypothetical protein
LGVEERPRFREYVVREHRPSFDYDDVHVGVVLPEQRIEFYDLPPEYDLKPGYAYTVINERPVIVDRRTRRVVEIIE